MHRAGSSAKQHMKKTTGAPCPTGNRMSTHFLSETASVHRIICLRDSFEMTLGFLDIHLESLCFHWGPPKHRSPLYLTINLRAFGIHGFRLTDAPSSHCGSGIRAVGIFTRRLQASVTRFHRESRTVSRITKLSNPDMRYRTLQTDGNPCDCWRSVCCALFEPRVERAR